MVGFSLPVSIPTVGTTTEAAAEEDVPVDAAEVAKWTAEVQSLEEQLAAKQKEYMEDTSHCEAALIFFKSRREAAEASTAIHSDRLDQFRVSPAPGPKEIIWKNSRLSMLTTWSRAIVGFCIVAVGLILYQVRNNIVMCSFSAANSVIFLQFQGPVTFVSGLTSVDDIEQYLPFLTQVLEM